MTGAVINGAIILLGAVLGLMRRQALTQRGQNQLRLWLAVGALFIGITTVYGAVQGSFPGWLRGLGVGFLALILGNLIGKGLGLQRGFERWLQRRMAAPLSGPGTTNPSKPLSVTPDFSQMLLWFVASPLMVVGIVQQGLANDWKVFALKGMVDATASYAWGILSPMRLAAAAVGMTLLLAVGAELVQELHPFLSNRSLLEGVHLAAGLLLMNSSLVLLGGRRVALVDQLPTLLVCPLLWRWLGP